MSPVLEKPVVVGCSRLQGGGVCPAASPDVRLEPQMTSHSKSPAKIVLSKFNVEMRRYKTAGGVRTRELTGGESE